MDLVNFTLDRGDIIIRTDRCGTLAAATRGAVVAFEADSLDPAGLVGWSVTVIGQWPPDWPGWRARSPCTSAREIINDAGPDQG